MEAIKILLLKYRNQLIKLNRDKDIQDEEHYSETEYYNGQRAILEIIIQDLEGLCQ